MWLCVCARACVPCVYVCGCVCGCACACPRVGVRACVSLSACLTDRKHVEGRSEVGPPSPEQSGGVPRPPHRSEESLLAPTPQRVIPNPPPQGADDGGAARRPAGDGRPPHRHRHGGPPLHPTAGAAFSHRGQGAANCAIPSIFITLLFFGTFPLTHLYKKNLYPAPARRGQP